MRTMKYTYWRDGRFFLGYFNDYPEYPTQGRSKKDLIESLVSLLDDLESGEIPCVRKVEELAIAE